MKKSLAAVAAAGAVAAFAAGPAASTTAPAYNFQIHVLVTNGAVKLDRSVARRGWLAHFVIQNRTSQTIRFEVGGLYSKPVRPGGSGKLGAFLDHRGRFIYNVDTKTKKPLKNRGGLFVVE
jgi:hypothetical protein